MTDDNSKFKFFAREYPLTPGVYLMKDQAGRIIYVGKAKRLRSRLSSYFRSTSAHTPKTKAMVSKIAQIDILLTSSEKEALLLEASLIKKHRPRYNVVLRDDKQYVLFRLDRKSKFPRLTMTRKVTRDGSIYFGPFISAAAARSTWKLLGKVFPLRKCSKHAFKNRVRPCLYYDMAQCLGPCVNDVEPERYAAVVKRVEMFLAGRTGELLERLERDMKAASESLQFERAAELRDQIRAVQMTVERQSVVLSKGGDMDVLGLAVSGDGLGLGVLFIRQGRLLDEKSFHWPGLTLDEGPEVLEGFMSQFYEAEKMIPPKILVPAALEVAALTDLLAERREAGVRIQVASSGQDKSLVAIARKVARRAKKEISITEMIGRKLMLGSEPIRIECVDASHLGGTGTRVGMVVFENGVRNKGESRVYTMPELDGSGDDYAALSRWAERRIESGPPWPDLVLVDGGLGQLATIERVLDDYDEAASWELASIAKGPSRRAGELEDRIFRPGRKNHMPLKAGSPELLFLQRVRDDAHRFVIGSQRRARKKTMLDSELLSLPGVGPKTARILWDRFKSVDAMMEAAPEDIRNLPGIGVKRAEQLAAQLAEMRAARKS